MGKRSVNPRFERLVAHGCAVCRGPAIIHHCGGGSVLDSGIKRGVGQKNSDDLTIPLCPHHHNGDEGIHTLGVRTWEERYGRQTEHLTMMEERA
jgi:hypothetical protein